MNNISLPRFGMQILAYTALDRSHLLNSLVSRISGSSDKRDELANKIISNTVTLGQNALISNKTLGKRSAEIVNQGRSVFFGNTLQQVDKGVGPLVELILQSKGQGGLAQNIASGIAQCLGPVLLQDHAVERVLVALTEQKGGENVLKLALENTLSGYTGGKIISATFMSALKRAILDRPEYKPTSPLHHMAAWKLHQSLTSDPASLPPAPFGLPTIEAIAGTVPSLVSTVCKQLDNIQNLLQLPLSEKELSSVFSECWPSDLAVTKDMTSKNFASIVMMAHATKQESILDEKIAELPDGIRQSFQQQCKEIRIFLSRIPDAQIKLAQNWSGGTESISVNHSKEHSPPAKLVDFMDNQFRAPVHHPEEVASYFADGAFIDAFKAGIDLKVDNRHQSYGRWAMGMGNQLFSQLQNIIGNDRQELTHAQRGQLGQLSEMVDNNPMSLMAMSRYLVPESIVSAVQDQVLGQFTRQGPDLILADNIWMKVGKPSVSFAVSKNNGVDIDIKLTWPISQFGKTAQTLEAAKDNQSHISSQVKVHMLFNEKGVEKQDMSISATQISLRDELTLTAAEDLTENTPIAFLNRGVLKQAFETASNC
ncbi:hypothetical protein ACQ4OC_00145 [Yersinia sp. J1]|uniref:hypothetical protein n=1 Tax=Yersinia sp. J1 TaxID=3424774 RepID=UPI003D36F4BA